VRIPAHEGGLHEKHHCQDVCLVPATNDAPFWMERIKHQGSAPFNPDPNGYKVFRNVKVCLVGFHVKSGILTFSRTLGPLGMVFTMIPPR
jgi:hypothetical protein